MKLQKTETLRQTTGMGKQYDTQQQRYRSEYSRHN